MVAATSPMMVDETERQERDSTQQRQDDDLSHAYGDGCSFNVVVSFHTPSKNLTSPGFAQAAVLDCSRTYCKVRY